MNIDFWHVKGIIELIEDYLNGNIEKGDNIVDVSYSVGDYSFIVQNTKKGQKFTVKNDQALTPMMDKTVVKYLDFLKKSDQLLDELRKKHDDWWVEDDFDSE